MFDGHEIASSFAFAGLRMLLLVDRKAVIWGVSFPSHLREFWGLHNENGNCDSPFLPLRPVEPVLCQKTFHHMMCDTYGFLGSLGPSKSYFFDPSGFRGTLMG